VPQTLFDAQNTHSCGEFDFSRSSGDWGAYTDAWVPPESEERMSSNGQVFVTSWDEAKETCLEVFLADETNEGTYTCLTLQEYPSNGKEWYCNSYRVPPQYDEKPFESEILTVARRGD